MRVFYALFEDDFFLCISWWQGRHSHLTMSGLL
jgi:hypothetical protein